MKTAPRKILNIAHRGFSGKYPENTLIAFQEALNLGVGMIEFDVHLTQDRKIVIHHDEALGRTSNGQGLVRDQTLNELQLLDAGSWFDKKFMGATIPTLEEALDMIGNQTMINIEIKKEAYEPHDSDDSIENQIAQLIQKMKLLHNTVISSFQTNSLRRLQKIHSGLSVALLSWGNDNKLALIDEIHPKSYHTFYERITLEEIDQIHRSNIMVNTFTVNDKETMQKMIALGVDGIITNFPDVLQKLLTIV